MPNVKKGKNTRKTVAYCLHPDLLRALDKNRRTFESKSRQVERLLWARLDPAREVTYYVHVQDQDYGVLGMNIEAKTADEACQEGLNRHTKHTGAPPVTLEKDPFQVFEEKNLTRYVFRGRKVTVKIT